MSGQFRPIAEGNCADDNAASGVRRRKKAKNAFFAAPWQRLVVLMEEAVFGDLRSVIWPVLLIQKNNIKKLENFPTINQATTIYDGPWQTWAFLQKLFSQIHEIFFHDASPFLHIVPDIRPVKGSPDECRLPHPQVLHNTAGGVACC